MEASRSEADCRHAVVTVGSSRFPVQTSVGKLGFLRLTLTELLSRSSLILGRIKRRTISLADLQLLIRGTTPNADYPSLTQAAPPAG